MNIFESMNRSFDAAIKDCTSKKPLKESVEAPAKEFKAIEIPAPFNIYYRTIQPEEYRDFLGCDYAECEDYAADYGVDELQYIIANDDYATCLSDMGMEVLSVYRDGDNIGIGQEVGGRLYPVEFSEIEGCLSECVKPVKEEVKAEVEPEKPVEEAVAEEPVKEELNLEEGKKDDRDMWDEVYGELTMDGEQKLVGKTYQFNRGVGYDMDNVWTGDNGEICIGAATLEELKPAAEIAMRHKADGVSYKMRRGRKYEKYDYIIEIAVPYEDVDECVDAPEKVEEEVEVKEELNPLEKLKKAYPELNLD